ncbi:MAG: pyridoxal-phosphate dependent enzyme [Anaerolineae bacterium]|nr:pyridoxal-phosphate dependent enzyme [Anaerolineae bacterium]
MSQTTIEDVLRAAVRIRPYIHHTPVMTCESLNRQVGAQVFLKCENLQKVGAFKFRGACNVVFALSGEQAQRGVATHSSGNHAQALSLAARLRGIPAYIVMPENAPAVKKAAVAGYGGQITFCAPTLQAREATLAQVIGQNGAVEVHPYDNDQIIAGQGTAALELIQQTGELDVVLAPVGGGGLLSGSAITTRALLPRARVIAAEPEMADDAYRSLQAGHIIPSVSPRTVADGLLTSLSPRTFAVIQRDVEQIVTVSEEAIIAAMRFVWERAKLLIEPSAAVPLGLLWERKIRLDGLRVGVILSGGNVDLERLPWQRSTA